MTAASLSLLGRSCRPVSTHTVLYLVCVCVCVSVSAAFLLCFVANACMRENASGQVWSVVKVPRIAFAPGYYLCSGDG